MRSRPLRGADAACVKRSKSTPEGAIAQGHVQVRAVLEVDVDQGAREARFAGDLLHRQIFDADDGGDDFGGVEDLGAPPLFLFLSSLADVVHGAQRSVAVTSCQKEIECLIIKRPSVPLGKRRLLG